MANQGKLFIVGTPIGNLGDLSPRAVEAFRAADAVCCEDTRVTGKLLSAAGVSRPLIRCDENVIAGRAPSLVDRMLAGETLAFASDAGMPGVSDPGQVLVDAAREAGVPVEVVPGPVACVTALVASGIPCDHFFFEGFLPRKAGERVRHLRQLMAVPGALLFYESPHRVAATLESVASVFPTRVAALCRELTKLHEEVLRAPAPELASQVAARIEAGEPVRGECVVVVAPPSAEEQAEMAARTAAGMSALSVDGAAPDPEEALRADIAEGLVSGEPANALAKRLAQKYSRRKREVYALILASEGN
ncbi:16S rRNA (cytidine(1402)-2'-O)-methyltransferase [Enorma massiliensis]|uniref:16S rRNA (cytidine(1402)-2'-O)-methyltransferase n=1 Tax=Enorma massiliensis TaxID=1472761 RepID=UPI003A955D79